MGCFGICTEEVLVSPLTFAGTGKTVIQEKLIMEITDIRIDAGKAFDWGRTSEEYAK